MRETFNIGCDDLIGIKGSWDPDHFHNCMASIGDFMYWYLVLGVFTALIMLIGGVITKQKPIEIIGVTLGSVVLGGFIWVIFICYIITEVFFYKKELKRRGINAKGGEYEL